MGRSWAIAWLVATMALASAGTATAQLRVGAEVDLSDAGLGSAPTLSYDSKRGGWLAFWYSEAEDLAADELDPR